MHASSNYHNSCPRKSLKKTNKQPLLLGQGSLYCCSPWGCKELDTTEPVYIHTHTHSHKKPLNFAICNAMDEHKGHYASERNQAEKDKNIV